MILALELIIWIIFAFTVLIMASYLLLTYLSYKAMRLYFTKNSFSNYNAILNSPLAPPLSIVSPAFNESKTIVDNVRTQLALHYNDYEVILVNDGSKDDSLERLIEAFQLEKKDIKIPQHLPTKEVTGVYKSTNPAYKKLMVIDKVNGGKADALNVGVNACSTNYVTCIDVDCVLEQDSLLRMIKPFLERTDKKRVIASGGVVRIANGCVIENGKLMKVEVPESFLPRVQVLEYIRAFLLGRMAWAKLDGLLLISGAFGLFDKDIVIKCGGYTLRAVSEDFELVIRMRRYMHDNKEPYVATYIPDPLCWTEVPDSYKMLGNQRSRWSRGLIETLWVHKKIFLNPKYGKLGLLSYPFWFIFEFLAPIVEAVGIVFTLILAYLNVINWNFFFLLLLFCYTFAAMYSMFAIMAEEETFHEYKKMSDYFKLIYSVLLEPTFFHPFITFSSIRGYVASMFGKKGWGKMTRKGFANKGHGAEFQHHHAGQPVKDMAGKPKPA
jgi:cellulose synthase/poly-beta-1,6-N-acetylglucosamine synthase-like glycosyltransferase